MKVPLLTLLFVLLASLTPLLASALGLSVTPPTISFRATAGKEATARFTVKNPSSEVALYEVYPEEFDDRLALVPSRFVLEAGEKREVTVRAKSREEGTIRTALAVEARPLGEPALGVGGGIRVPLSLTVEQESGFLAAVSASGAARGAILFLLGALTVLAFVLRRITFNNKTG